MSHLTIGILALQGGFAKHAEKVQMLGAQTLEVRRPEELERCDALIIPGGESTAIFKQMHERDFVLPLQAFAKHKPLFGTCAGLILLSQSIAKDALQPLGILDVEVERNAFGRQRESGLSQIHLQFPSSQSFQGVFIRAPKIRKCGEAVKVLGTLQQEPVLIQQGIHLGATFHPELTADLTIHQYFLQIYTT